MAKTGQDTARGDARQSSNSRQDLTVIQMNSHTFANGGLGLGLVSRDVALRGFFIASVVLCSAVQLHACMCAQDIAVLFRSPRLYKVCRALHLPLG